MVKEHNVSVDGEFLPHETMIVQHSYNTFKGVHYDVTFFIYDI